MVEVSLTVLWQNLILYKGQPKNYNNRLVEEGLNVQIGSHKKMNEEERLKYMNMLLKSQLSLEQDDLANLSNASAIIMACVERLIGRL